MTAEPGPLGWRTTAGFAGALGLLAIGGLASRKKRAPR
jgi:hypothetical protein